MKYFISLTLLFFLNSSSYSQNKNIEDLDTQIENYIFKKPDSAKVYLFKLLKYADVMEDTITAKTYSKLGITYNQLGVYDSSEYYFKKGIHLLENHPSIQANLYSNLAINYRTNAEYSKSIEALNTAMKLYKKTGNLTGEGVVFGELASNYSYRLEKAKAISHLKKAISIFKTTKDPRLHIMQQKLANAYFNNGNYEFAIDLFEQALPKFAEDKGAGYYLTLPAYAESLIQLKRVKEGEDLLLEAYAGLKEINNKEYMYVVRGKLGILYQNTNRQQKASQALKEAYENLRDMHSTRFLEAARGYLKYLNEKGDYSKAITVIAEVEKATDNFHDKLNAEDELHFLEEARLTYRETKLYEQSLITFDRIDFLKDSLKNSIDQIKIKQLEESYQNQIQREKNLALSNNNTLLKKNSDKQWYIIYLILAIGIILKVVIFIIYKYNRKKLALEKEVVENLKKTNAVLHENQLLERELSEEKENSLRIKEREIVTMAMEIADIQNQIKDLVNAGKVNEISPKFADQIIGILDQKNYWQHFNTSFTEIYPDFTESLLQMFPNLTESELAFCAMLKLQLSTKEIASLMGTDPETVVSMKNRIQKKMALQDDKVRFEALMQEL